jgi:hypothetical protein
MMRELGCKTAGVSIDVRDLRFASVETVGHLNESGAEIGGALDGKCATGQHAIAGKIVEAAVRCGG